MRSETSCATTGAESRVPFRCNLEDVSIETLYGHIAIRIAEAVNGDIVNFDKIAAVAKWMKSGRRSGLVLMGGTGTGKTTLARALSDAIGVRSLTPRMFHMQKLERICRDDSTWFDEIVNEKKFLILDDVGTESREVNLYGNRRMLFNEIIFARYDLRLPVIITTNLNSALLLERYGEKVVSRLKEMCDTILMVGNDLRV